MSDAQLAVGLDRLPWLADEPQPRVKRGSSELAAWAAAAIFVVAGTSYWMGLRSSEQPEVLRQPAATRSTTVPLPEAKPIQPEVELPSTSDVEPVVAPPMPVIETPRIIKRAAPSTADVARKVEAPTVVESQPTTIDPLQPWPARVVEGAAGRLVRIGAFATPRQAKKGWWWIVRMNPALQRLPAVVVPMQSLRNGQTYYRLQIGTTSQAHSEVLCQRMRMVAQSCVVIGLAEARYD